MSEETVGRVAIVTGAGSGIGRAAAYKLGMQGYVVALVGRTRATLEELKVRIEEKGQRALVFKADVSKVEDVDALVEAVVKQCGGVHVLVNNAGNAPVIPMAEISPEQWHEVINTNLSAAFYTTRAVWPHMLKNGVSTVYQARGVIVNISSMASKDPFRGLGAYAVAKAGLNMLTLVTAREGDAAGIRVVCIAPGAVDTAMFRAVVGDQPVDAENVLQPQDVANMIGDALHGSLRYTSGDTLFIHRRAL